MHLAFIYVRKTNILKKIELVENGFCFCPEVTAKISKLGEKIVEVPVEKIVEKIVVKEVEVPKGPSVQEKLAEAMSRVHKGQMLPEEKSELVKLKEELTSSLLFKS